MKTTTIIIVFILSLRALSFAGELPYEVTLLIQKREEAVSKIDKRFAEELEALKVKYTKQGDLNAANEVVMLLSATEKRSELKQTPIIGGWDFFYQGKKRKYQFKEDGTFTGEFPVSGNAFSGTWRANGTQYFLETNGGKERFATIKIGANEEADFKNREYEMIGKRAK